MSSESILQRILSLTSVCPNIPVTNSLLPTCEATICKSSPDTQAVVKFKRLRFVKSYDIVSFFHRVKARVFYIQASNLGPVRPQNFQALDSLSARTVDHVRNTFTRDPLRSNRNRLTIIKLESKATYPRVPVKEASHSDQVACSFSTTPK